MDLNNFYASIECLYNLELPVKVVAVSGDLENRHGIILAKKNKPKEPYQALFNVNGISVGLRPPGPIRTFSDGKNPPSVNKDTVMVG